MFPSNFSRICMHFSKTNSYLAAVSLVQGLRDRGWGAFSGLGTVSLVVPSCSINKCNVDKWNGAFSSALGAWNLHIDLKNGKTRIDFMSTYDSVHPNLNVWSQPKAGQQGTKGVDNSIPCVTAPTRARSCVSLECKTIKTGLIKSSSRSNLCHISLSVALKYLKNNENYLLSLWSVSPSQNIFNSSRGSYWRRRRRKKKWNDRYFVQSWLKNASSCPLIFLKESCADLPSKSLELEAFFRNSNLKHV